MNTHYRTDHRLIAVVLFVIVFLAFGNALKNDFVWDDGYLIVQNPFIKSFRHLPQLFKGDLSMSASIIHHKTRYFRPVSMISFMIDYALWGLNPLGYHLVNILIHFANCLLVYGICLLLTRDQAVSAFSAVLFAIHPVHVEAVTPIFNRMGIQAAFFLLSGVFVFLCSDRLKRLPFLGGAILLFILGLLSKENVIIFPLICLGIDFFYWSEFTIKDIMKKRKLVFYGSLFAICALYLLIRRANMVESIPFLLGEGSLSASPALASNGWQHLATVIEIVARFVTKAFIPLQFSALYWIDPVQNVFNTRFLAHVSLIILFVTLMITQRHKHKSVSFFIAFFFVALLPYWNIIPIGAAYTFRERFLYLPSIATCFILAKILISGFYRYQSNRMVGIISMGAVIALIFTFTTLTIKNNRIWKNNLTLWSHTVTANPESQMAYMNLGQAYINRKQYDKAIEVLTKSLNIRGLKALDGSYLAHLNLANIFIEQQHYEKAIDEVRKAVPLAEKMKLNPFALYDKLGLIYVKMGQVQAAIDYFEKAIASRPAFTGSWYNLGLLYYEQKDLQKAEDYLKQATSLERDFIPAWHLLGLVYQAQGQQEKAAEIFQMMGGKR